MIKLLLKVIGGILVFFISITVICLLWTMWFDFMMWLRSIILGGD